MQIDAHMRFRPHWDSYLIHLWFRCRGRSSGGNHTPSLKPVITAYPPPYVIGKDISTEDIVPTVLVS